MDNGNMQENGGAGSSSGEGSGFTQGNADNNAFVQPGEDTGASSQGAQSDGQGFSQGNTQNGFAQSGGQNFSQGGEQSGFSQGNTQNGFSQSGGQGFSQGNTQGGFSQPNQGFSQGGFTQANGGYSQPVQGGNFSQSTGSIAESNAFSITGMILGILSIVCCCCSCRGIPLSILLAVAGLVFSIIALVKHCPGRGMAIAGVICSSVGLLMWIAFVAMIAMLPNDEHELREFQRFLEQYQHDL